MAADILMYHGIDSHGAATSITPSVFADQMSALAESGRPVRSLNSWLARPDEDAVIITFDDALTSFADVAWPILQSHEFPVTLYVATACVGGMEDWRGGHRPARRILSWSALEDLVADGVHVGGHSRTHPDLTELAGQDIADEIAVPRRELEDRLGQKCGHFAPPYGATTPPVRRAIAAHWDSSVGVTLDLASADSDCFDLPRIEMLYFTDIGRWRSHLAGSGKFYFTVRQSLRAIRRRLRA